MRHATYIRRRRRSCISTHRHTHLHARLSFRNYIPTYIHTHYTTHNGHARQSTCLLFTITSHHITSRSQTTPSFPTSHQPHTTSTTSPTSSQSNPVPLRTTTARRSAFPAPPPFAGGSYDTLFFFPPSSALFILACFMYKSAFTRLSIYLSFYIHTYIRT